MTTQSIAAIPSIINSQSSDRLLLADVFRWAYARDADTGLPRFERIYAGWYSSRNSLIEITRRDGFDLTITMREDRRGPTAQVTLPAELVTVRRAVDLLVTLGILPDHFSSAYATGREGGVS